MWSRNSYLETQHSSSLQYLGPSGLIYKKTLKFVRPLSQKSCVDVLHLKFLISESVLYSFLHRTKINLRTLSNPWVGACNSHDHHGLLQKPLCYRVNHP